MGRLDEGFAGEQEAARALLEDVTHVLSEVGVGFVVVGGWVTKLFHSARFGHPGTYDADILLDERSVDDGSFERAAEVMLKGGYVRAVKNRFQAHRVLRVADEELIFHADFLNPRAPVDDIDLVVGTGRLRSIYTPAMGLVMRSQQFRHLDPTQYPSLAGVRFPSVDTFIATKAAAVLVKKRQRDAFDVFVSLLDDGPANVGKRWRAYPKTEVAFAEAANSIGKAIFEADAIKKIAKFAPCGEAQIKQTFVEFLDEAGWDPDARIGPATTSSE